MYIDLYIHSFITFINFSIVQGLVQVHVFGECWKFIFMWTSSLAGQTLGEVLPQRLARETSEQVPGTVIWYSNTKFSTKIPTLLLYSKTASWMIKVLFTKNLVFDIILCIPRY